MFCILVAVMAMITFKTMMTATLVMLIDYTFGFCCSSYEESAITACNLPHLKANSLKASYTDLQPKPLNPIPKP